MTELAAVTRETLGVDHALELAATYRREIRADVGRIWENVLDWEHLPHLHDVYFNAVELLERDQRGWSVKLLRQPGDPDRVQVLRLDIDREATRYRVRTIEGTGAGTEIWTLMRPLEAGRTAIRGTPIMKSLGLMRPLEAGRTAIEVRYYVPEARAERLGTLGGKYRASCQRLWDEDETMMMRRASLAPRHPSVGAYPPIQLGSLAALRARLPVHVEAGGEPFRVVEIAGELLAHATICPHWSGPLDDAGIDAQGAIRCPWHGYRFDIRSGACLDGHACRLPRPPVVRVDPATGAVTLERATAGQGAAPP